MALCKRYLDDPLAYCHQCGAAPDNLCRINDAPTNSFGPSTSDPGKALRYNAGKAPLGHILDYPRAMKQLAMVSEYGAAKYNRGNFQRGQKASVTIDCMFRHLFKWWCGEDHDPESGCHHLAHFLWNAVVLVEDMMAARGTADSGIEDDDRTFNSMEFDSPRTEDVA